MAKNIWVRKDTAEEINRFLVHTIHDQLGIQITEVGPDYLEGTMPVDERTCQPFGYLHGGASAVLAESLASIASILATEEGYAPMGLELSVHHLKSAPKGSVVTGRAIPIRLGRQVHRWSVEIRNPEGEMTCLVTAVIMPSPIRK